MELDRSRNKRCKGLPK
jgi:uncharacterized protein with GYD domain